MCKGTEAGKGRVESSGDLKRLKLEVGNLRSPSQGPDLRWWPWPWLSGIGQRGKYQRDQSLGFQGGRVDRTWLLIECQAEIGRIGPLLVSDID